MPGFDVLDPHLDLKKSYFLEASAGTGKTFTIENIVVRLLQGGMAVDKILIVTFTRAATLELKIRIRKRLEEKNMRAALTAWDEAKIFTIHGFCFHTLKEHAFETGFSLMQSEEGASPEDRKQILKDFLRTDLSAEEIHPRQLEKALKKGRNGIESLIQNLSKPSCESGRSYRAIQDETREVVASLSKRLTADELMEIAPRFKGFCDKRGALHPEYFEGFQRAARLLSGDVEDFVDLPLLKMIPSNLKQKQTYPEALEECFTTLFPLLTEASDTHLILGRLAARARHFLTQVCERDDLFFYDDFIVQMQKNVRDPSFASAVRAEYEAVLIDEFQDTDPVQWEIFSTLFLHHLPLYVVGDPKQSIYRFRGADLYAYLEAKEALGERAYATLTRNFRSQPSLVDSLNTLFQRSGDLIHLPKTNQAISILPITAALPQTHEGKATFCVADDEESLFAFIASEIERLNSEEGIPYRECAVLVKDRYQAQRFCGGFPLPFATKKSESLLTSDAFPVLEDLLLAVFNPRERSYVVKALAGPLFRCPLEELADKMESWIEPLYRYHTLLITKGLLPFFQTVADEVIFPSKDLYLDLWQLVELIAENTAGVEEYLSYLQKLKLEDPEAEFLKARLKCTEDAVQVMTLHVSKGLEFEAVFPVALMREAEMQEAEDLSEKMRQLYVALTRAKRHLYLPVIDNGSTPMQFFLSKVLQEESLEVFVNHHPSFSLVNCKERPPLRPLPQAPLAPKPSSKTYSFSFPPCGIHSYTSLAPQVDYVPSLALPADQMPAGPEIGVLLHKVFEKLDFTMNGDALRTFLEAELKGTPLEPWLTAVEEMVSHTLHAQLPAPHGPFSLAEVDPAKMIREMEFLYPSTAPAGYLKGFIDLFFEHRGYFYCIDWKSNFLVNYNAEAIQESIAMHHYALQAQIYQSATYKYLTLFDKQERLAGSFYLFLRGMRAKTSEGIYFFNALGEK
ncbi:UvrD-helicase domain-containing protein [Chlamydiota bacterium]